MENSMTAGRLRTWFLVAALTLILMRVAGADNVSYAFSATGFPVVDSFSFTVTAADFITDSGTFFSFNSFSSLLGCSLESVTLYGDGTITFTWMPLCNGSDSGITGFGPDTITRLGNYIVTSSGGDTVTQLSVFRSNLPITGPSVPEPGTLPLLGCGFTLLALMRNRLRA
jgi:hypothetical protein